MSEIQMPQKPNSFQAIITDTKIVSEVPLVILFRHAILSQVRGVIRA